jgi:hypothetical protein
MADTVFSKRLILRAVLHQVGPMVSRLISVADRLQLREFHDIFRAILGWDGDLGYIIRIHGQEFNSFRRKTRSKALHDSNCTGRKSSSISVTRCICGSGMFASLIFRTLSKATISPSASVAAVLRPRSFAAVGPVTGS